MGDSCVRTCGSAPGDVPFFGTCTDQTALLLEDGARIEDYFVCPSYDAARAKLQNLNEQDLDFQIGLIRAAMAVYADLQAREAAAIAKQAQAERGQSKMRQWRWN